MENNKNLEILKGKPIIEISPHSVTLSSGETLQTNVTVWTAGIGGQAFNYNPRSQKNCLRQDYSQQVLPGLLLDGGVFDTVFAIGDISAFQ